MARKLVDPADFITDSVMRGATALVYGTLVMRRKIERPAPFTMRRRSGEMTHRRAEMDWLMRWERAAADGTGAKTALDSRLTTAPGAALSVLNQLQDGDWAAAEYKLQVDYPFHVEARPNRGSSNCWAFVTAQRPDASNWGR